MKKSFVLYNDSMSFIEMMSDEDAGILFKQVFLYHNEKDFRNDVPETVAITFAMLKSQFERDKKKYDDFIKKQQENGKKGGRPKNPENPSLILANPSEPKKAVSDSVSDSVSVSDSEKKVKEKKKVFGEHKNVLLSESELKKIKERFPKSWEEKIENMSNGIAMKGYVYKSHYLAILKWAKDEVKEEVDPILAIFNQKLKESNEQSN